MLPGETFAQFAARLQREGRARLDQQRRDATSSMRSSRKTFYERKAETRVDKKAAAVAAAHRARLRTEGREDYASDEEALGRSLKDAVRFGERVEAPPRLAVKPRHAGSASTKAGERMMHLLERGKWGGGSAAPAGTHPTSSRDAAISEYRKLRARQAEAKRVRAAAGNASAAPAQGKQRTSKALKTQAPRPPTLGGSAF